MPGEVIEGKYSIELFKPAAKAPASRKWLDRHDNLAVARAIYRGGESW
jgi:hypothetical protein